LSRCPGGLRGYDDFRILGAEVARLLLDLAYVVPVSIKLYDRWPIAGATSFQKIHETRRF
jgi:hypothetical protein